MNRNYFLLIAYAALACLVLIFAFFFWGIQAPEEKKPAVNPPTAPYKSYISGVGIVEASSENILINAPVNRIVDKVSVELGQKVKKGDELIQLENKDLQANLEVQKAAYNIAKVKLEKLKALPRPEDVTNAEANVQSAQVEFDLAKHQYEMALNLPDPRAISQEDFARRKFNFQMAESKLKQAQASMDKIKRGAWKPDLAIAQQVVAQAQADVKRSEVEVQRTSIKSPIDGTVLQINAQPGETASVDSSQPLMIIGNKDVLFLRVSINQLDIPYFNEKAPAVAYRQDDASVQFPLEFVKVNPYLVDKEKLTNRISEKVHTNVLQIMYRIKNQHRLYIGEQMDVYIETNRSK